MDPIDSHRLEALRTTAGAGPVLILTHDNPDPDALASGVALAYLLEKAWGVPSRLVYSGVVGRAENWAMLTHLTPGWEHMDILPDLGDFSAIALLDTQPRAGNNRLPENVAADIVFDHHLPRRKGLEKIKFLELQPEMGATASLLAAYLEAAGLQPEPQLATALFYGLKTDTRGLSRGGTPYEERLYLRLLSLLDRRQLQLVEQAGLSREYFRAFDHGLQAAMVFGKAVFAFLGEMTRPDLAAEMADLLIRLEGSRAVLCLGVCRGMLSISLRTRKLDQDAGLLIQEIVPPPGNAGGHGRMAGGQMPVGAGALTNQVSEIQKRYLEVVGETTEGTPLL